jgi:flavin-dependent dehydrogenase
LHLDDLLRRYLESAGVQLQQGVKVRRLIVEQGRIVGAASDDHEWRAPITIAADGPGSLAWAALDLEYQRGRQLAVASTAYYENVEFGSDAGVSEHYFEIDLPCGYGWAFPPVEGLANIGVYQRADHFERGGQKLPRMLERFVARHPERFVAARLRGKVRVWSLPLATAPRPPAGPGVLACGDAGRFIDPLSGEGIWQALHTGRLAGQHAVLALSRHGLDAKAARAYQRACERAIIWPSMLRLGVQEAMRTLVSSGAYQRPLIKRALAWGYQGDALEITKRTS